MEDLLRRPAWRVALALVLALALLAGAHGTPLFDQDEAAYAGFARGMRDGGDWVLHAYPWSDMHRKPPLALWLMAASTGLLGESNLALRLPAAACVAATILLVATWGGRHLGQDRARVAAALLATSVFPLFGRLAMTDPVLLLAETVAVLGLAEVLAGRPRRGAAATLVGLAAGLLTKGPAVLLFLGVTGLGLLVLHPARRRLLSPWLWLGWPLAFLPLLGWGWLAWQADGGATVRWMLDWYLLQRAGGAVLGQTSPPGTYLLTFLVFLLPWVAFLPAGLWAAGRALWARSADAALVWAWLGGGWLAWELLPSKLPSYPLGAYPALALVLAGPVLELGSSTGRGGLVRAGLAGELLVVLALAAGLCWAGLGPLALGGGVVAAGAWLGLAGGGCLLALLLGRTRPGLGLGLVAAPVFLALAFTVAMPGLRLRLHPTATVAEVAATLAPPAAPALLADAWRLPSLPYYLEGQSRRVEILPVDQAERRLYAPGPWLLVLPEAPATLPPGVRQEVIDAWIPDKGRPTRFVVLARDG